MENNNIKSFVENIDKTTLKNIKILSVILKNNHMIKKSIFEITDREKVLNIMNEIKSSRAFVRKNTKRNYLNALNKYLSFIDKSENQPNKECQDASIEEVRNILLENYGNKGFRIKSYIECDRFRMLWEETFEKELELTDEGLINVIKTMTFSYNDMNFLPEVLVTHDEKTRIFDFIHDAFNHGNEIIYYEAIFSQNKPKNIKDAQMLKEYLRFVNDGSFYIKNKYLTSREDAELNVALEVNQYLLEHKEPVSKDKIFADLSYLPKNKINFILNGSSTDAIIVDRKGTYFNADNIDLTQEELSFISNIIQKYIQAKQFISDKELMTYIQETKPYIREKYSYVTDKGFRDALEYKFKDKFSFKGKIISSKDDSFSMKDVFAHYAEVHDTFTLDSLRELKQELDIPNIYFKDIYDHSVRVNKDTFISDRAIEFNVKQTDDAITNYCTEEYIPLHDISSFIFFPEMQRFPWNYFLLEQYVYRFSTEYKLYHTVFAENDVSGVVIKRSSTKSFDEVMADALAHSNVELLTDESLNWLKDKGIILRKNLSNIEDIVRRARRIRNKR